MTYTKEVAFLPQSGLSDVFFLALFGAAHVRTILVLYSMPMLLSRLSAVTDESWASMVGNSLEMTTAALVHLNDRIAYRFIDIRSCTHTPIEVTF